MKTATLTVPQVALIAGTRAILGAGVAFLLSDLLTSEQRRAVGVALTAVGVVTTIPLAIEVFGCCGKKED